MKKKNITFHEALKALSSSTAPVPRTLRGLTSLDANQLTEFEAVWQTLGPNRRAAIVEKLGDLIDTDFELDFNPIFRFTLTDVEESVRLASVEGLWEDESYNLIDAFVVLLRSDPSAVVRAATATALGRFMYLGEIERITHHRRDQVYSALMGALITEPAASIVYDRALESISFTSNEQIQQFIHDAFLSDDPGLRVAAVVAMGRSGDAKYAQPVARQLNNVLPIMRAEAARACGELAVHDAVPALGKLLDDSESDVILAAIDALAEIGGDDAKKILEQASESEDEEIAEAAKEALEDFDFMHGDIKFATEWFDDLVQFGHAEGDADNTPGDGNSEQRTDATD
ncbi:MAG TPA: HEAT repeat domain-containing protein [Anaerolineae bacterium]|jgi:HEAT repeat protein